ncbi:MAG: bacillithiol system redox-active protein YtxJ [Planctomycetes bacterium]|nr:bacillithiol system redox-active protein YtxJ [Planctomycetota bacterium]
MALQELNSSDELDDLLSSGISGLIFKHSSRCSVSTEAHREVTKFLTDSPDVPVYLVLVVENRPTSLAIAEKLAVTHASPQVIVLRDGEAVWDASHWDITQKQLQTAWSGD